METSLRQNRIARISGLVKSLERDQQIILEFQLQKLILNEKTRNLERSIG